jgi:hypothetical protein
MDEIPLIVRSDGEMRSPTVTFPPAKLRELKLPAMLRVSAASRSV